MSRDTGYEAKGASVVGKLWSSVFGRVVTDRQPPTAPSKPEKSSIEEPALGMKLTGDPHPLDRLVRSSRIPSRLSSSRTACHGSSFLVST